ncbi:MAG: hypothetical protein QOF71_3434 [Candidatus Eremiobacteraeota bacterium]|nr:hypothetical protein [Candidatus Eremiobacteraeota bacterium]
MAPMPGMPMKTPAPAAKSTQAPAAATPAPSMAPMPGMTKSPGPAASMAPGMNMQHGAAMRMQGANDLAVPMEREVSGTAWQPDSAPEYGTMHATPASMLMTHYAAFPRYVDTGSTRGSRRFDAPNWLMVMGSHTAGTNAQFGYHAMISLDPLTENRNGYPLLYQTGETAYGAALHDRQHPHDLFSELSASYSVKTGMRSSAYVYVGYPGEPALGPPTYMHRPIAYDMADAPIGHHWQDATHVTFGVVTAGYDFGRFKFEGSAFTGTEPNEFRYNFDRPHLDSYGGRVSWNPNANVALQISNGYIKSPEVLDPNVDQHRTTASVLYNKALGYESNWYAGAVWGRNRPTGVSPASSAYLLETDYRRDGNAYYARFERVQKAGQELVLPNPFVAGTLFDVGSYTFGYVRDLNRQVNGTRVGLGAQITFAPKSAGLDRYYGAGTPAAFQVFLRLRPTATTMNASEPGLVTGRRR